MAAKPTTALKIEKLIDRPEHLKVLAYGESGVGKTVFAASAPRPILWLESEGGTQSIGNKTDIDIARVTNLDSYREALVYLQANPGKYQTVVLDSFSESMAAVLSEIMGRVVQLDEARDEYSPNFPEWQKLTGVGREIARAFRDLPMNVVITALAREDKDDLTGKIKVRPKMTPALADDLPTFMDAVIYLYAATVKKGEVDKDGVTPDDDGATIVRNGLIRPTGKYAAKVRAPKGSNPTDFIADPDFAKVAAIVFPRPIKAAKA